MIKQNKLLLFAFGATIFVQPIFAQLKPGDVAPNAKVIDADYLFPFNMGAAIVKKGQAWGLIDMNGNFLVPYNKYSGISQFTSTQAVKVATGGIFIISDKESSDGAINSKGKLITAAFPEARWRAASEDGKLIVTSNTYKQGYLYLDAEGHQYFLKELLPNIVDGIGIVTENYKSGYKNIKGEWIIKPTYDDAEPFSEGMACVARKDDFGVTKWGFIDTKGKEVIPIMYTVRPEPFRGGLSRVTPKDYREFKQAYINKKGEIVQKFNDIIYYNYIGNGLYYGGFNIMDSTGKVMPVNDFLKQLGIVMLASDKNVHMGIEFTEGITPNNDRKICFGRLPKESVIGNFGVVDLNTKVIMEGLFEHSTLDFFDPVSKLACTKFNLTKNRRDKIPLREGYVNEQGIFVIVKGEASNW